MAYFTKRSCSQDKGRLWPEHGGFECCHWHQERDNVEKTYTASSGSAGSNPPKAAESPKFSVLVSVAAALGISAANFSISCSQFNKRTLLQQLQAIP